jgi:hypothetical protein
MGFGAASISSTPLVLRIVLGWLVVSHVLAQLGDSWADFDGAVHELLVVEV